MKKILFTLLLIGAFMFTGSAFAATISDATVAVGTASGAPGSNVSVTVTCDGKAGTVGGTAFTLTYDKDKFSFVELTKDTIFVAEPLGDYCGGTIEGCTTNPYTLTTGGVPKTEAAFLYQANAATTPGEVKIAAASAVGVTGSKVLFKATFKIAAGVAAADYTIGIKKTSITNADAGYATATDLPMLVGMPSATPDASGYYLAQDTFTVASPTSGKITVTAAGTLGDANGDETVNISDAAQIVQYIVNGTSLPNEAMADVNKDETVNISDAAKIVQYIVNDVPLE